MSDPIEHKIYGVGFARCADCNCAEPPCEEAQKWLELSNQRCARMLKHSFESTKEAI
jgi:hypothetical protein